MNAASTIGESAIRGGKKALAAPHGAFQFLTEVRQELAKVVWPTRQQTIRLTLIVVGVSLVTALYIGILDVAFTELINIIIGTA